MIESEIATVIVKQLVEDFGCRWAACFEAQADGRDVIAFAGETGTPHDDSVVDSRGGRTLVVEFAFRPETPAEIRIEAKILATSLVNGYAALRVVRAAETADTGTILIVDDDIGVRTLVRHVLLREGFAVIEAANGLIAHARALEFKPDLIIIDWMMPELDGHAAAIRLKADPFAAAIPIVMLTSRSQAQDKIAALAAGVQDFLTKPFEPKTLTDSVRQQLRWRRLLSDGSAPVALVAPPRLEPNAEGPHLARFVEIAEVAEEQQQFDDAAQAYMRAADLAVTTVNPDIGNKFRRLAGKMYLLLAESAADPASIQHGYASAARAFLAAGNLTLASTANASAKDVPV
jgi:DNA-binding response OmpR family regulator